VSRPRPAARRARRGARAPLVALAALLVAAVVAGLLVRGGGDAGRAPGVPVPPGAEGRSARPFADPYAWTPARSGAFARRAAAGTSHVLYALSPGGAAASAARTARWRADVERVARAARVDPDRLEALVLLESAGRPDAVTPAGVDGAAGLVQILPETATDLLGLTVDTSRSGRDSARIARARATGRAGRVRALERRRAAEDERFDPRKALAGAGRYLALAERRFGREDLAFVSYHMGIGNLEGVLSAYGAGRVPYARLYFDSTPTRHAAAWRRLAAFGDDSSNYVWKLGAAEAIMARFRRDPARLDTLARLQTAAPDARFVLHPPGERVAAPEAVRPLPAWTGLSRPRPLRLQPTALALALYAGAQVRAQVGGGTLQLAGAGPGGWTFDVARRYASPAQAQAFQFALDRLAVLDVIAWSRAGRRIRITVSRDARSLLPLLQRLPPGTR
jgi:transglycosylase-like protein with SLT domain